MGFVLNNHYDDVIEAAGTFLRHSEELMRVVTEKSSHRSDAEHPNREKH
jgi:hypothetical protein